MSSWVQIPPLPQTEEKCISPKNFTLPILNASLKEVRFRKIWQLLEILFKITRI